MRGFLVFSVAAGSRARGRRPQLPQGKERFQALARSRPALAQPAGRFIHGLQVDRFALLARQAHGHFLDAVVVGEARVIGAQDGPDMSWSPARSNHCSDFRAWRTPAGPDTARGCHRRPRDPPLSAAILRPKSAASDPLVWCHDRLFTRQCLLCHPDLLCNGFP